MDTESLVLALAGGAVGFVLSLASIKALVALAPPDLPRIGEISIDVPVFWFCLAVALVTGLLSGVVPALWVSRFDLGATLKEKIYKAALIVVGVVGDVPNDGRHFGVRPAVYVPRLQESYYPTSLLARTGGKASVAAPAVRAAIRSLDRRLVITRIDALEDRLASATAGLRFNTLLMSIFAVLAFLLAASGVYSLMSYTVTLRTREMSIRMAMGANHADILLLVFRTGTILAGIGVALGLAGALGMDRFVSTLLYQVEPHDKISFIVATALLAAAALAACYLPARRAANMEIVETLRQE